MLGGCYVFYFYFYFALRSKIFSEKVGKPINKKYEAYGNQLKNKKVHEFKWIKTKSCIEKVKGDPNLSAWNQYY